MARPNINNRVFGVMMILTQIALSLLHGFFVKTVQQASIKDTTSLTFNDIPNSSVWQPLIVSLMTVLGFGLIFSYNKRLMWSGLGYTFFIVAFVLQLFPLINSFWTKTQIMGTTIRGFGVNTFADNSSISLYLSRDSDAGFYQNHIIEAFRCAIAIAVAFSCILGRVGSLECWFLVVFGTFGFQLNRQICYGLYQSKKDLFGDAFGTMNIFAFGGFMGLGAALVLSCRQGKDETTTCKHRNYTANRFSITYALLGTILLAITLPFLISTWQSKTQPNNKFLRFTSVICVILSIAASTLTTVSIGLIAKGGLVARHLVYGPIAGAVIGGTSAYYTTQPVYAIIIGVIGGVLQTIFMLIKQYTVEKGMKPITTVSFSLFGIQGLIGSAIAIGWKAIVEGNSNNLNYVPLGENSANLILYGLICSGIGLGVGLLIGVLIFIVNSHLRHEQFTDKTNWHWEDCINNTETPEEDKEEAEYYEGEEIKNQHAYL